MQFIREQSKNKENSLTINTRPMGAISVKPLLLNRLSRPSARQPSSRLTRRDNSSSARLLQTGPSGYQSLRKIEQPGDCPLSQQLARLRTGPNPHPFLQRHAITPHYRAKMVDWMIEVVESFEFTSSTLFLSVSILDSYFDRVPRSLSLEELHQSGVACLFVAIKYEEMNPLKLRHVFEKVGHKKIPVQKIKEREAEVLEACEFRLAHAPTLFEYIGVVCHYSGLQAIPQFKQFSGVLARALLFNYTLITKTPALDIVFGIITISLRVTDNYNRTNYFHSKLLELGKRLGVDVRKWIATGNELATSLLGTDLQERRNLLKYSKFQLQKQLQKLMLKQ